MLQISHILLNSVQVEETTLALNATHYIDDQIHPKATLIYLHGGGLLAGSRQDLPALHQQFFTQAGVQIIALDYPLSPQVQIDQILASLLQSIKLLKNQPHFNTHLPLFLWGRSAGAYLALLIGAKCSQNAEFPPIAGILSFYGYGFLTDGWYDSPSAYYAKLPKIEESTFQALTKTPQVETDRNAFASYIYARQTGLWKSLIYQGRDKFFYLDYSLRASELNLPLFFAHATGDPDVPFAEFNALCAKYPAQRFVAATDVHDFDDNEQSPLTQDLLQASLKFIQQHL
ncbi:hypothetical protein A4G18_03505 [Pasteurellaceae bacterium Pebbles2]|nr:hypothetical protein [Pasteurellaceae bacterium Pebbles2]